jgi:hypothetical protein
MKYTYEKCDFGAVNNLGRQLQKILRQTKDNRYETRYRYMHANERFINFLGRAYKVQKLSNIQDKHLAKYVESYFKRVSLINILKLSFQV